MIGLTFLHYEVIAELGVGSMGRVYLARDTRTGRRVALKFVEGDATPGAAGSHHMAREARAASRLSHPGIVALLSFEEASGRCFLVEEYVEGEALAERLKRGPLGTQESLRLALELAAALAHAHANGVLHRDLKPANILVAPDGSYKIADFGVARIEGVPTTTSAATLLGTLSYIAPERLRGHRGDARADLFSVGAVLYEAMTARRAFPGSTEAEVCYLILNEEPRPIVASGPAAASLRDLVMQLLAKEPSARPASAEKLRDLVAAIAPGLPSTRPGWRPGRRSIALAGGSLVLLALLVIWGPTLRPPRPPDAFGIAVLPFENVVDPQDPTRLGPVVSNLLTASLAEGSVDSVLSSERVLDILHSLGRVGGPVDRRLAKSVARRANARLIVTGSILRIDRGYLMTAEVSETGSGRIVDVARADGNAAQSVFDVVDLLSAKIARRRRPAAIPAVAGPVEQRGTKDLHAYQEYVAGLESLARGEVAQAIRLFSAALDRDPSFQLAAYQLSFAQWLASSSVPREAP